MKRKSTSRSCFGNLRVLIGFFVALVGAHLALASFGALTANAQRMGNGQKNIVITHSDNPLVPVPFDCSQIERLGIDKQLNLRAQAIMIACGRATGGSSPPKSLVGVLTQSLKKLIYPLVYGTTDVDVITGAETWPYVTQSTTFAVGNPDNPLQMLVAYNDARGAHASPPNGSGASWSTDGGNTFVRLTGSDGQSPFQVRRAIPSPVPSSHSNLVHDLGRLYTVRWPWRIQDNYSGRRNELDPFLRYHRL